MNLLLRKAQLNKQLWLRVLLVTGLVFGLWWQPEYVSAQEWATLGNNIYNLNTGNVGIGTTGPMEKLEVAGNLRMNNSFGLRLLNGRDTYVQPTDNTSDAHIFVSQSGIGDFGQLAGNLIIQARTQGTVSRDIIFAGSGTGSVTVPRVTIKGTGNVGIGTTGPAFSAGFFGLNIADTNNEAIDPTIRLSETGSGLGNFEIRSTRSGSGNMLQIGEGISTFLTIRSDDDGGGTTSRGNVGIGRTNPGAKLDVLGASGVPNMTNALGRFEDSVGSGLNVDIGGVNNSYGWIRAYTSGVGEKNLSLQPNGGNVGIGTTSPNDQLDVTNPASAAVMRINGVGNSYLRFSRSGSQDWQVGTDVITGTSGDFQFWNPSVGGVMSLQKSAGNVGIGVTDPSSNIGSTKVLEIGGTYGGIVLRSSVPSTNKVEIGNYGYNTMVFATNDAERMRINSVGNVGIGTTAPATALHVVGDVTVTGNIAAKYQDVAEWVPAAFPIPAGTVLTLDSGHSNHVMPSSHAYDIQVAGVVTETPGILLGEGGEGKVKVATTGRVKVKVDASQSPVRIGDLLVTSDKEGMAMRSEPVDLGGIRLHRPGTIIGKALEPLDAGEGEVLVLLVLQ